MSEKRKPTAVFVAEILGKPNLRNKRMRVELFRAEDFPFASIPVHNRAGKYRVRVNGKWVAPKECFTLSRVMTDLRKWANHQLLK